MEEKNYYEILEIDKNASIEIIDKAYKTLVKKYHPDVQDDVSDDKIKKIIEAYEVISDSEKREIYDSNLKSNTISIDDFNKLNFENEILKKENEELFQRINNLISSNYKRPVNEIPKQRTTSIYKNNDFYSQVVQPPQEAYTPSKFENYRNHYKMTDNSTIKNIISLCLTLLLFASLSYILWIIPFTHNYLVSIYDNNVALQSLINLFIK